jgi:PEP-CTERM motif
MQLPTSLKRTVTAMAMAAFTVSATAGATINLIDIGGVTGSQAEKGFKIAAKYWESVLTNNVVLNFNVGFSNLGPNILGSTGSNLFQFVPVSDYYSLLGSNANMSTLDQQAFANLAPLSGTGSLTVTVPQYFNTMTLNGAATTGIRIAPDNTAISQTIALSTANGKALVGGGTNIIDAEIQFSSAFNFDFNPTNGITAGSYDFIGVAVHEMGHALGFISGADDFDYVAGSSTPNIDDAWWGYGMDMFRYSAPGVLDWTFGTDSYFSLDGGVTRYMGGSLSTGAFNGDGNQASHWKEPNQATPCLNFLGIMNPYICNAQVDSVTGLDLALFDAIGWNLNVDVTANPGYRMSTAQMYSDFASSVPEPSSVALLLAALGIMGAVSRRRAKGVAQ